MTKTRMTKNRTTMNRYQQEYEDGNTVRKLEPVRELPQYSPEPKPRKKTQKENYTDRKKNAQFIILPYVLMLSMAMLYSGYILVSYLQLQSSIISHVREVASLETSLEAMKSENDEREANIKAYVDLDHVYQVATEELGMVYPGKDQIIHYDQTESEYVRQNEDIPK